LENEEVGGLDAPLLAFDVVGERARRRREFLFGLVVEALRVGSRPICP
jgi:hypothetical protein